MENLKYSGAQWLGNVPSHWRVDKLKYHLMRNEPKNPGDQIVLSLYRELGVIPKDSRDDNHNVTSEDTSKYKYVRPGDFVINKMKAWQGSVAVSDYEGIVSPAYFVYNFTDELFYKRFFHYLLRGCYKDEFMRLSGGIRVGQWDLPSEALDNVLVLIPPLNEQEAISGYLDTRCVEIDSLSADIQAQIDALEQYKRSVITETVTKGLNPDAKKKDSGIQWIGMMPSHWNCIRGKYILKYIQKPIREDDGVITCFRDGEVTLRSNRREDGFTVADKEIGYQGIDVGDLVVHGMDGFAGAIGISDSRGKASPVLNVLDTEQNKRYIMYFLRSMAYIRAYAIHKLNSADLQNATWLAAELPTRWYCCLWHGITTINKRSSVLVAGLRFLLHYEAAPVEIRPICHSIRPASQFSLRVCYVIMMTNSIWQPQNTESLTIWHSKPDDLAVVLVLALCDNDAQQQTYPGENRLVFQNSPKL